MTNTSYISKENLESFSPEERRRLLEERRLDAYYAALNLENASNAARPEARVMFTPMNQAAVKRQGEALVKQTIAQNPTSSLEAQPLEPGVSNQAGRIDIEAARAEVNQARERVND